MKRAARPAWSIVLAACVVAVVSAGQPAPAYRILLTNDDGVRAPGLVALAKALATVGNVTIVAPAENQSGKGHSISITDPIYADEVDLGGGLRATALTATPVSCVKVALAAFLPERPSLVVSGVNRGSNLGLVAYVSGTVGAAREAAMQGLPAIASSLQIRRGEPADYTAAAEMTRRVAALVKAHGLPRGVFLNMNVPAGLSGEVKGLRLATPSEQAGTERFEARHTPGGRRYFWNVWQEPGADVEGTDASALAAGYAAVVPLHVGEFDRDAFERLKQVMK